MEIFLNTSTLINSGNFSLNTDILETNLINIAILVVVLVQFVGGALTTSLADRKQKIVDNINDAETRLTEAKDRLAEANVQLAQTKVAIDKIVQELQVTKVNIIKTGANRISQEMVAQMKSSELAISLQEQKLLTQIKQQIITLAIKRVVTKLKQDLTISQHVLIINKCIKRLGGLIKYE
jgi:F-type H+-transporting ATPase subunit b